MEQFNPGLRNLINLGKSYEKAVSAMALAGKQYFDAVSKIGENAAVSPVSRELGDKSRNLPLFGQITSKRRPRFPRHRCSSATGAS
ncbi:Brain-specific angiogenesis inhibitor 1-associated protein 2-like protein 1 [Anabarilius grahami]|uniref:Brain-specific angiogenesis inhibitor 1-associated protein 2-like protein 1 n=1 Tax=Anabarilius grahami TaxID=495550 RepID=A0A3N0YUC5_ANAGA|nr:Brain-specific angiogenesis inhibitor 1-associated protein 2-like protein 1 [Anabarilius grahami]